MISRTVPKEISDGPSLDDGATLAGLRPVGFLPELRGVEARVLFGRAHPQRREDVDNSKDRVGSAEGKGRHDDARQSLDSQLPRIPEEQAVRAGRVDHG